MAFWNNNNTLVNPVENFLDWKGKDTDGKFTMYNKETKENIDYELEKFAIVDVWYTVKGYSNNREIGIYSNEIKHFGSKLRVITSGKPSEIICEWIYKDIKDTIVSEWGKLHMWVTFMDMNTWYLWEFFVKGNAYYNFNQLLDSYQKALWEDNPLIIEYKGAELVEGKAFNYNEPKFEITNERISDEDKVTFNEYCNAVDKYTADIKEKYKDESVAPTTEEPKGEYAKPAGIESDEEFAKQVKAEQVEKKTKKVNDEEISIEDIPF